MSSLETQRINAAIAANYDAVGYTGHRYGGLDPERLVGLASLFGPTRWPVDVLDLGCGDGAQLAQVADKVDGRLVGTDISGNACARARDTLKAWGDRVEIRCEDLLELDVESLGEFDLIYNIGVIYVAPIDVQKRIVEVIGRCLKPGGLAVVSYYAGSRAAINATLNALLVATVSDMNDYATAVTHVRRQLKDLKEMATDAVVRDVIDSVERKSDVVLFHESLNHGLRPLNTTELEQQFRNWNVEFAAYLFPNGTLERQTSVERAVAAGVYDLMGGAYHYALFCKQSMERGATLDAPGTLFGTELRETEKQLSDGVKFSQSNGVATLHNEASIAVLRSMMDQPLSWSDINSLIAQSIGSRQLRARSQEQAMRDLHTLLDKGLIYPLKPRPAR